MPLASSDTAENTSASISLRIAPVMYGSVRVGVYAFNRFCTIQAMTTSFPNVLNFMLFVSSW